MLGFLDNFNTGGYRKLSAWESTMDSNASTLEEKSSSFSVSELKEAIQHHLQYSIGVALDLATPHDLYKAVGLAVRQALIDGMIETENRYRRHSAKRVYYLSIEFLIGKSLENNLINLNLLDTCRRALSELGIDLELLVDTEPDAGLGNGGLGRLAACFVDSMATAGIPGYGYGINYEFGLFRQEIQKGWQREKPDNWLSRGTPWQLERQQEQVVVPLYGRIEEVKDLAGQVNSMWVGWKAIVGVPHDMPIAGYEAKTVNHLRLFSARGWHDFDMELFNEGDYIQAVEEKNRGETISKVLYPSDAIAEGRELRLIQEYFMVACSIRDIINRHESEHGDIRSLPQFVAIQMNDTHPALAVAELMRVLVDEKEIAWADAWDITQRTLSYTNHTLLPEALEKLPVSLFEFVLPRHLLIIYAINEQLIDGIKEKWPNDVERIREMSLIEQNEEGEQLIRMCHLAIVGSHSVNGVSALHSKLIQSQLVPQFHEYYPGKFSNKTNGITPRRWLLVANPRLATLISNTIGNSWITDLYQLRGLEQHISDGDFIEQFRRTKDECKIRLSSIIKQTTGVSVDHQSMFDVQVKRIHQYKRQLMSILRIIREYLAIVEDGYIPACPRTYIFAGKAAPGYWEAKQIIGFINQVGLVINKDARANDWIKIAFIPNYRVSLAERIYPAADLSEQISTSGFEASGTSNMKFMLNGALTMGTLDGANIEILEEVGEDNIFIFGLTAEQIQANRAQNPLDIYNSEPETRRVFDAIRRGAFSSPKNECQFDWIYSKLVEEYDPFFHLADGQAYWDAQVKAGELFKDTNSWTEKALLNVARSGKFSSDRTIQEYARDIWSVKSIDSI